MGWKGLWGLYCRGRVCSGRSDEHARTNVCACGPEINDMFYIFRSRGPINLTRDRRARFPPNRWRTARTARCMLDAAHRSIHDDESGIWGRVRAGVLGIIISFPPPQ